LIHENRWRDFVAPGFLARRARLPDLTVPTDSIACVRWQRCTFCGQPLAAFAFRVWQGPHLAVGVVLCVACQRLDEDVLTVAVDLMMTARYDPQRFGHNAPGGADGPDDSQ